MLTIKKYIERTNMNSITKSLWFFVVLYLSLVLVSRNCLAEQLCSWEISVTEKDTGEVRYYVPKTDKGKSGPVKIKAGEKLMAQCFFTVGEPTKVIDDLAQTISAVCTTGPDENASIIEPKSIAIIDSNKKLQSYATLFNILSHDLEVKHTVRMYCKEALK